MQQTSLFDGRLQVEDEHLVVQDLQRGVAQPDQGVVVFAPTCEVTAFRAVESGSNGKCQNPPLFLTRGRGR